MPIIHEGELDIISYHADQTTRLGVRLGRLLQAGDVICLSGDMGAGKTMFAAGIGMGWGAIHALTSPTFNLVHQHKRNQDDVLLYHLDCYRLRNADDTESIGLEDMLETKGVLIIEWAERILTALPPHYLWIEFRALETTRRNLFLEAHGERYKHLVEQFRQTAFKTTGS